MAVTVPGLELPLHHGELSRRQARPVDPLRLQSALVLQGEGAQSLFERFERETGVEQRADDHVTGGTRKAVQVQHAAHWPSAPSEKYDTKFLHPQKTPLQDVRQHQVVADLYAQRKASPCLDFSRPSAPS